MSALTIDQFQGMDLRDDPQEAGVRAIDGINFDLDQPGRVRSRDGYAKLSTSAASSRLTTLGYSRSLHDLVAVTASSKGVAYDADSGAIIATSADLVDAGVASVVPFGVPGTSYIYLPKGTTDTTIARWDGTTWTYPATGYSAHLAAVTPSDNRLVLANFIGPTEEGSTVRFSNRGAPETFGVNDDVILTPGDGEQITGICSWGNQTFVFKETKFFVFYSTSTDSTGEPIFNYRTVSTGVGASAAGFGQSVGCCAGQDGVYFLSGDGIYRTTGGNPVKVSGALDPLFGGHAASPYTDQIAFVASTVFMAAVEKRVYFSCQTVAGPRRTFVYDTQTGQWMPWSLDANGIGYRTTTESSKPELVFAYASGTNDLGTFTPGLTTDDNAAIASRYRTGFLDLGTPGSEKVVREWLLEGSGDVTFKTAVNDSAALSAGVPISLGFSPAVARGTDRTDVLGRNFSLEVGASSGAWSLSRLSAAGIYERSPGMRSVA